MRDLCETLVVSVNAQASQPCSSFSHGYACCECYACCKLYGTCVSQPPDVRDSHFVQTKIGTLLLYYWATGLLRLMFGSFVVAVLVGSFNTVRSQIEKETREEVLETHLNLLQLFDGEHDAHDRAWVRDLLWYVVSWRTCSSFAPCLARKTLQLVSQSNENNEVVKWNVKFLNGTIIHRQLQNRPACACAKSLPAVKACLAIGKQLTKLCKAGFEELLRGLSPQQFCS